MKILYNIMENEDYLEVSEHLFEKTIFFLKKWKQENLRCLSLRSSEDAGWCNRLFKIIIPSSAIVGEVYFLIFDLFWGFFGGGSYFCLLLACDTRRGSKCACGREHALLCKDCCQDGVRSRGGWEPHGTELRAVELPSLDQPTTKIRAYCWI